MKKLVVFGMMVILFGCVSPVQKRVQYYENLINPKIGKATTVDVLRFAGPPTKKETRNGREFWYYHLSFGVTGGVYRFNPHLPYNFNAREMYDDIFLEFDEQGILRSWRVWVQR